MNHVLLGEWGFLDNLDDTSGNGLTASANFTPTYIDGPTPGTRAIRFSGTGQQISYGRAGLEPAAADGGICTMAWVKLFSSHANFTDILHKTRAFDSTRHAIDVNGNSMWFMSRWRDQTIFSDITSRDLTDLGWHHICNVDADDRYAWFWDGILLTSAARSGSSSVSWENFPWVSGSNSDMSSTDSASSVAFTGLRIFSGTLSNVEVATWMNTDIVPPSRSGKPKIRNGSAWVSHPAKIWNGSSWISKPIKGHDGTDWVIAK